MLRLKRILEGMDALVDILERIAGSLERIEKALPGCNQEAFREEIKKGIISILASERTHLEYK